MAPQVAMSGGGAGRVRKPLWGGVQRSSGTALPSEMVLRLLQEN